MIVFYAAVRIRGSKLLFSESYHRSVPVEWTLPAISAFQVGEWKTGLPTNSQDKFALFSRDARFWFAFGRLGQEAVGGERGGDESSADLLL